LIGKRPFEKETTYAAYTNGKGDAPVPDTVPEIIPEDQIDISVRPENE
jgi:hypothetical protein